MAIDTAAKRRNVGRLLTPVLALAITPSGTIDDDQRYNIGWVYIGLDYGVIVEATPENVDLDCTVTTGLTLDCTATSNINLDCTVE